MSKPIDTIIDRFGGVTKLARALSLPVTTVHSWKRRGCIPSGHQGAILAAARANEVAIGPADFFEVAA
jgi:hypothetical protein